MINNTTKFKIMTTLKTNSRIDNSNGYLITKKDYTCEVVKMLPYNYCIIKINNKIFKTDFSNIVNQ